MARKRQPSRERELVKEAEMKDDGRVDFLAKIDELNAQGSGSLTPGARKAIDEYCQPVWNALREYFQKVRKQSGGNTPFAYKILTPLVFNSAGQIRDRSLALITGIALKALFNHLLNRC